MMDWKDYQFIDVVFYFICAFVDRAAENIEDEKLTKLNTMYSKRLLNVCSRSLKSTMGPKSWTLLLKRGARESKETMVRLFKNHCKCGLLAMKFHLSDHSCHRLKTFCSVQFASGALWEHFGVVLKRA